VVLLHDFSLLQVGRASAANIPGQTAFVPGAREQSLHSIKWFLKQSGYIFLFRTIIEKKVILRLSKVPAMSLSE